MNKEVYTVAFIEAKEDKFDELKRVASELAKNTLKEEGVIEYTIIEDTTRKNTLFSIEKWENNEQEAKHWDTPHLLKALSEMEELLIKDVTIYKGTYKL